MILADFILDTVEASLQAIQSLVDPVKSRPHLRIHVRTKVVDPLPQPLTHSVDVFAEIINSLP